VVLIVCPFINLCRQWIRELDSFGVQAIPCFQSKNKWEKNLEEGYQRLYVGLSEVCAIVTTSATFFSENFQARIQSRLYYRSFHHILIADEVHNLGAQQSKNKLPENIQLRLGLSATPERYMDPAGTEAVLSYFGGTVYEYPISRAISDGHLCRYRYVPIRVKLTNKEVEKYEKITSQLARIFSRGDLNNDINHAAMRLLIERSRLLSSATGKLHELDKLIANLPQKPKKAIFYCGDGRTTDTIHEDEIRQIQSVSRILGEKHNLRIRNFTFRESIQEREEILRDLETGFLDGVVAIRCLDEGIDLPDLRMGFILASSTNPRQFIQRRGRLLRNAPGKEYAIIYDFIIEPPDLGGKISDSAFNLERAFFQRELKRIVEFCRIADNGPEAMNLLKDLRLKYNLLSM
jgi:superfamily II DNA or RNA helicase